MSVTARNRRIFEECMTSDEPCIVFRAKDMFAPRIVATAAGIYLSGGCDEEFVEAVEEMGRQFDAYQHDHPDKVKIPDLRREEVDI